MPIHPDRRGAGTTLPAGIEATPGVCGGDPRVAGTRITVWMLEQARRLRATVERLVDEYPALRPQDVRNAWAYAEEHPSEIDGQIHENEDA